MLTFLIFLKYYRENVWEMLTKKQADTISHKPSKYDSHIKMDFTNNGSMGAMRKFEKILLP